MNATMHTAVDVKVRTALGLSMVGTYLWCEVLWSAAVSLQTSSFVSALGQSEIYRIRLHNTVTITTTTTITTILTITITITITIIIIERNTMLTSRKICDKMYTIPILTCHFDVNV
jgi:hypothetical protein